MGATYYAGLIHEDGHKCIGCCTSLGQAREWIMKQYEDFAQRGFKIVAVYIEGAGLKKNARTEQEGKNEFTHFRVVYKSIYGGRDILFIPASADLDTELDRIEDNAGIIEITKVTRNTTTNKESRLVSRLEASSPLSGNLQHGDTDARLSGLRIQ